MAQLIPLSRLARLVGKPRSVLQKMAQSGELETFDGQVALHEVLRHFPDIRLENDTELLRVQEIMDSAVAKQPSREELPTASVLNERLRALGRDFADAEGRLLHYERVHGWIAEKLAAAVEAGEATAEFAERLSSWLKAELSTPPTGLERWEDLVARERILRVMSATVTVVPKGQTFEVVGDETILEAGLRAGLSLPYGCSNGSCGDCKCRVISGEVMKVRPHDYQLKNLEKSQGYTLACSYAAVGDIAVEVPLAGAADIPEQTINARVRQVEPLGGRRIALHLITPRTERFRYLAGQWMEITAAGETRRVPAASCPCDERRIEVHVECDAPAEVAAGPFSALETNAEVIVHGPFGGFVLDDESTRPVLLIAEGPGFALIKSLLQHALSLEHAPSITLARRSNAEGLYQENLLKSYAGALDDFAYVPLSPDAAPDAVVLAAFPDGLGSLATHDVYAAGAAEFIAALRDKLLSAGLPEAQWRAEVVA
jgi:CDP-4-dehydro-6-deoxyglucose reductase